MEIRCKFVSADAETTGTTNNGTQWTKRHFVCETLGQYSKKMAFQLWNDKTQLVTNCKTGEEITVKFDAESREYNGKYYTDLKAFEVVRTAQPVQAQAAPVQQQQKPDDGLPW